MLQFYVDEVDTESHGSVEKEDDIEEAGSSLTERDDLPEAIASWSKCEECSTQTTSKTPWRSSRVTKKPKWQESGDYCMGISKQLMMLQSLLSSSVIKTLDPSVISVVTKGISDSL